MQECDQASICQYSVELAGVAGARCAICRFAPDNREYPSLRQYFMSTVPGKRHPLAKAEKLQKTAAVKAERTARRNTADLSRRTLLRKAARAEKTTEQNLIRSTRNSGRSNKDGDHIAGSGEITLDTKLQTKRENPVVLLHEIVKVGEDSKRAGTMMGALVLRNKHGVGVVAMAESDFARLIERIG